MSSATARSNHSRRLRSFAWELIDRNTGLMERDRILLQATEVGTIFLGFGSRDVLRSQLFQAEQLTKQYDENQARDQNGQWTSEGGTSGATLTSVAVALAPAANPASGLDGLIGKIPNSLSIFQKLGPQALEALTALAATFAAPATFLGAYFFPFGRSAVASGALPDHPGINYQYDSDTGHFSLYTDDRQVLFTGVAGADGPDSYRPG